MEIVAFDTDDRADGQGKAGITWISKNIIRITFSQKIGQTYNTSLLRTYLNGALYNNLPQTIHSGIVPVTKITKTGWSNNAPVITTSEEVIWVPSARELNGGAPYQERTGAIYDSKFIDSASRAKHHLITTTKSYMLRSNYGPGGTTYYQVTEMGAVSSYAIDSKYAFIALGFCTN